jgi:hypothetical protein
VVRRIGCRTSKRSRHAGHRVGGVSGPGLREPLAYQFHDPSEGFALMTGRLVQLVRTSAFLRGPKPGHGFQELAHGRRLLARGLVDGPHRGRRLLESVDYFGLVLLAALAETGDESVARGRELDQRQSVEASDLGVAVRCGRRVTSARSRRHARGSGSAEELSERWPASGAESEAGRPAHAVSFHRPHATEADQGNYFDSLFGCVGAVLGVPDTFGSPAAWDDR